MAEQSAVENHDKSEKYNIYKALYGKSAVDIFCFYGHFSDCTDQFQCGNRVKQYLSFFVKFER